VLFHYANQKWWAYLPARHYPTHVGYRNCCSITTKPINTFPVTPILFELKIHVPLPVSPIDTAPQMPPDTQPLLTRLATPPKSWEEPLWYNIQPHAHTDALRSAIIQRHVIRLVSDAAVHPSGYGTCAWIIRAKQDLWTGEGYVPAPLNDLYSGLAKVYGIHTLLSFFSIHTTLPINHPATSATPRILRQCGCHSKNQWIPQPTPATRYPP